MRVTSMLLALLVAAPAYAESYWDHNGSVVQLNSDGTSREIIYLQPRAGLPVAQGTVIFRGTAAGTHYTGTAYAFSSRCGAIGFEVSGRVIAGQKRIVLSGRAPARLDAGCSVTSSKDEVLVFSFQQCGCECGEEFELAAIYPPPLRPGSTEAQEGTSCPYLYAWSDQHMRWDQYGKVIRDARGLILEMTDVIRLSTFALKFKLSEEEPEHSFIDQAKLTIELREGQKIEFKPDIKSSCRP